MRATVVTRSEREESYRSGGRAHHRTVRTLDVAGTLASGQPFEATFDVDDVALYEAQPEGSTMDFVVRSSDPTDYLPAATVTNADDSGHQPGEGTERILFSVGFAGVAGLVVGRVPAIRQRRQARS